MESLRQSLRQSINTSCCHLFSCLNIPDETEALELETLEAQAPAVDGIVAVLTDASNSVPDARLIIAASCCPESTSIDPAIVCLPPTVSGKTLFGVIQTHENVDFTMHLSFNKGALNSPTEFQYRIIYDPTSDNCLFIDEFNARRTGVIEERPMMFLTNLSSPSAPSRLFNRGASRTIRPGAWSISVALSVEEAGKYPLAEFMLQKRRFNVLLYKAPPATPAVTGVEPSLKKLKLDENAEEVTVSEPAATSTETLEATVSCPGPAPEDLREIIDEDSIPILELKKRETAVIQATNTEAAGRYHLRMIRTIYRTDYTTVITCRHSEMPEEVVAKVLHFSSKSGEHVLKSCVKNWKSEKKTLEKLNHRNIVSLKAVNGRIFSLYLELLPPCLFTGWTSNLKVHHAPKILRDTAIALEYLTGQGVVHNDIKPCNIAFSIDRGAVIIDFGLATSIREQACGGSPWFLPPDIIEGGKRGLAGDVWALGVTMLYILRKITMPDYQLFGLRLRHLCKEDEKVKRLMEWQETVASARATLDQTNELENIVFKMLEPDGEVRIKAADIVSGLGNLGLDVPEDNSF
ncbi:kinase-like domain-containing protein [Trichoderma chlorosporum]